MQLTIPMCTASNASSFGRLDDEWRQLAKEASRAQSAVCPTLAHSLATLHSGLALYRQFGGVRRAELAAARQALAQSEQVVAALRAESESLRPSLADEFKVRHM